MSSAPCACRDCMEIATSNNPVTEEIYDADSEDCVTVTRDAPTLCWKCEEAECLAYAERQPGEPPHMYECQREEAYEEIRKRFGSRVEPHPRVWPNYIDSP